tara:strand:- start:356 stop:877 length:522 start_codon:yes stop_codon:yes gene_type:complete
MKISHNKNLFIKSKNFVKKSNIDYFDSYDVIEYNPDDSWVDIINYVGMEKSLQEVEQNFLYNRVVFANEEKPYNNISNLSRYTIYSYNSILIQKHNIESKWISYMLSTRAPSIWNWQSDSLTFDIISNVTKEYFDECMWEFGNDYDKQPPTSSKQFLKYLHMQNIHIKDGLNL